MKKTAVEWLEEQFNLNLNSPLSPKFQDIIEAAKSIEKHQIKKAWLIDGYYDSNKELGNAEFEQYYNETFKN